MRKASVWNGVNKETEMSKENDMIRFVLPEIKEYGTADYWTFLVTDSELIVYKTSFFAAAFGGYWAMLICSAIRRSLASKKIGKISSDITPSAGRKLVFSRNDGPIRLQTKKTGLGKSFEILILSDQLKLDVTNENIMNQLKQHCPEIELVTV